MAFQIKDDLFDYGTSNVGKPLGIDIKEKKMTLPLIYALDNCTKSKKKEIIHMIKKRSEDKEVINTVISFVRGSGGLEYAQEVMNKYRQEAARYSTRFSRE
jgi:Geranylgeranyl pyrophosphate synthase